MKGPVPLSREFLNDAISLVEEIFTYKCDQIQARKNLIESLSKPNTDKNYWITFDENRKVIGIIGLYLDPKKRNDKITAWLGWFGVHSDYRKRGIGSELLKFIIGKAKRRGVKTLRIYTSLDKNERAAHKLYEKYGFRRTNLDRDTEIIYYAKDLSEETGKRKEKILDLHIIEVKWKGPFTVQWVIEKRNDEGEPPDYGGDDYGLYQIYGNHILCGPNTLLYIGKATKQTFSRRFKNHKKWLDNEEGVEVYLGKIYDPKRHSKKNNWKSWELDVHKAESILIYKYSPNYNNIGIGDKPDLSPFKNILLIHKGKRHRLEIKDNAPEDYS